MKKKVWIWVGVSIGIIAIIAASVIFAFNYFPTQQVSSMEDDIHVTVQAAKEEKLAQSILVTGQIVPENEQKLYANPENGEIQGFEVKENQEVKKGDVLYTYDSSSLEREFNKAVRDRELLEKRSQMEINQMESFNKKITEAKNSVGKPVEPVSVEEETEGDLEEPIEDLVMVTEDDVRQLENEKLQLEMEHEGTKDEITTTQETINELDEKIKEMTVTSEINGIIVKINKDTASAEEGVTEPVVHIVSNEPYKVIGTMNEFDAVKIAKDQSVIIRPKVYNDREWNGVVESVSHFPDDNGAEADFGMEGSNVTTYPFTVAITDDTSELRQGFHVSIEVSTGGEKVLAVPHTAIIEDDFFEAEEDMSTGEITEIVYVLVDGVLEQRIVETGEMNDEFIEITSGVESGELVVIYPEPDWYDGMEVISFDEVE
ncbi:efflux RND transporter periplasmic adaptor subunit [Gracilibacillus alcaliphilus]|uniref:efflux RND transporter periplasmic adaptor subunit n=1 Tax=Gracilibacillus alcaliphilus TaxID=1401441 RepID=UPI00195B4B96|nr:biotin/lipoyl-binding protein [Gracilibacillus alcaliphilus]MBM7676496.1 multidrug efflux pump subunit AcrA (membrane-fusion protein) [Gracilibacillus alcaliphilus]